MSGDSLRDPLLRQDYLLLATFCAVLFGLSLVGGRPLSRHEGVLPQSSREMLADHDFIVPKSGGRPWLESPPLPQWITVGVASVFGRCDREWIVRIAPAAMGTIVVLLVGWMAAGWYGRSIGLLSALVTATLSELTRYAWLAEDEIFLCAIITIAMALFVRLEFFGGLRAADESCSFFGKRPWGMFWFFVALGATNLAKGVVFGTVITTAPIGAYLFWNRDWSRLRAYCWSWGWLAFAVMAAAWPLAVMQRYPDAPQVWFYDQLGRVSGEYTAINQPAWYYLTHLPEILAPWILAVPFALAITWREAFMVRRSPARFLWCWALVMPLVLSIPGGKHHHYLLHGVAPWGVLVALALVWLRAKIMAWPEWTRNPLGAIPALGLPGAIAFLIAAHKLGWPLWSAVFVVPIWLTLCVAFSWGLWQSTPRVAAGTLIAAVALGYMAGHVVAGKYFDRYRDDTRFLKQVARTVPADKWLFVNAGMGQLEAFHTLFYLDERTRSLHNLSYLIDDRIQADEVYVVTYVRDEPVLAMFGSAEQVLASSGTWRDGVLDERLTLYRLRFHQRLARKKVTERISPMQAMNYAVGPFLTALPEPKTLR
ncbi:MAG: hypothetical protein K1X71_17645 [Pirellulales bacterium]|nr:hypothetical protein [Pirellulales bacterium]